MEGYRQLVISEERSWLKQSLEEATRLLADVVISALKHEARTKTKTASATTIREQLQNTYTELKNEVQKL